MSILVTGGAGYIGSHVVQYLLEQNEDVIVVDNLSTGNRKYVLTDKFYEVDISDMQSLYKVFKGHKIDVVIHFAAFSLVGESMKNPFKYYQNNVYTTSCLLEVMRLNNVDKIVFSSTAAVYGDAKQIPILETSPTLPTNTYGQTKLSIEQMMEWFEKAYGLKHIALRYFNAAGADINSKIGELRQNETHLIPIILRGLIDGKNSINVFGKDYETTDGTCIRDYIHVVDLAQAHYLAGKALLNGASSNFYNLGNGNGYSVLEVIEAAKKVTGRDIEIIFEDRRAGDPPTLVASSEKIKQELSFEPKYSQIEKMIEDAWNFYKKM